MNSSQLMALTIVFLLVVRLISQIRTIIKNKEYKNVIKEYEKEKRKKKKE